MNIFITRVWGFDPENWPVIPFIKDGHRDKLLRESSPGDLIVFVATKGDPTLEELRGRLLGMAEIGREAVDTLDVIGDGPHEPWAYNEKGQFRWPKAIPMLKAWRFKPQPMLLDVIDRQLPRSATSQGVLLSANDADAVRNLKKTEVVEIKKTETLKQAQLLGKALSASGQTTGPKPSSWTGETGRDVNRTSFTYAFRFGDTDIWKIGHTIDVEKRLKEVNLHIPSEVIPCQWVSRYAQRWGSEPDAHAMEQRVLEALEKKRTEGERVKCTERELLSAWLVGIGTKPLLMQ